MLAHRIERLATLLLLFLTACTVFPAARTTPHAATRRVVIPGEEADTLAETSGDSDGELVAVRTHDGREVWVPEASLGGASLVPGTWVLLRQGGALVTAAVARSLDDFVEVDAAGVRAIVPVSDVVARLHHGPVAPETPPPPPPVVTTPPPPPPAPTPIAHMVVLEATSQARVAMLDACTGDVADVTFPDGTQAHVPRSDLRPLRVRAGDHVTAMWNGSAPYPATIVATRDSLVRARWDDESPEQWIELTDVQSVDGVATGSVSGCPHRAVLVDQGARTRIGRLLACEASSATVLDSEGAPRTVSRESLTRVPLHVGDAVEARWNGTPYEAIVLGIGERVHVRWYDASEGDVDPADLVTFRAREARASEPAICPDV